MILNVSFFGLLLVVLGCFGAVLGRLGAVLGRLGAVFGGLGTVLCSLQPVLGRSWALLEQSWVVLGRYGVRILVFPWFHEDLTPPGREWPPPSGGSSTVWGALGGDYRGGNQAAWL